MAAGETIIQADVIHNYYGHMATSAHDIKLIIVVSIVWMFIFAALMASYHEYTRQAALDREYIIQTTIMALKRGEI